MKKCGKLFVISGPSGVGKNTLIEKFLLQNPDVKLSISNTTRKPRAGEIDGVNYFFTQWQDFLDAVKNNEFLEWAEFGGNCYGTKQAYVEKKLDEGSDLILEIDTQGAMQIKAKIPEAVLIFVMPPSLEALEKRLRGRQTESEEAIQTRLAAAKRELETAGKFDYQIVNDDLEQAVIGLQSLFRL